jgi:hypothetical protein
MPIANTQWETAEEYLETLPSGLDSLRHERVRRDVVQAVLDELAEADRDHPLTSRVLASVATLREDTLPEVWFQAMTTRLAQRLGPEGYFDWARRDSGRLVDRPFFRPLMRVLSPTLLLMGSARRWGALREGTSTLTSGPVRKSDSRKSADLVLAFPPNLFSTAFLDSLGPSFSVLVEAARGSDPQVDRTTVSSGESHYRLSWS